MQDVEVSTRTGETTRFWVWAGAVALFLAMVGAGAAETGPLGGFGLALFGLVTVAVVVLSYVVAPTLEHSFGALSTRFCALLLVVIVGTGLLLSASEGFVATALWMLLFLLVTARFRFDANTRGNLLCMVATAVALIAASIVQDGGIRVASMAAFNAFIILCLAGLVFVLLLSIRRRGLARSSRA